jgi:hypothetical protein
MTLLSTVAEAAHAHTHAIPDTTGLQTALDGHAAPTLAAPAIDLAAVRAEAAVAERARIAALDAIALPGFEAMIATAKADGQAPAEVALAMCAALKASKRLDAVDALRAGAETVPPLDPAPNDPTAAAPAPVAAEGEEAWRAEYAKSPALQAEFKLAGGVDAFVAYRRAETAGRVRIRRA